MRGGSNPRETVATLGPSDYSDPEEFMRTGWPLPSSMWRATLLCAAALVLLWATSRLSARQAAPAPELTLRIIIVGTQDEAQRVVERLRAGEGFETIARQVSIDPTADQGGLLGTVALSALRPEIGGALAGVGPGQISPIVPVPTGFAVLQVVAPARSGGAAAAPMTPAVAATGSVRYVFNISGFNEAQTSLRDFPKPPDWNLDPKTFCQMRVQSLAAAQSALERVIREETAAGGAPSPQRMHAHFVLGQLHAWQGRMQEAIDHFDQARRIIAVGRQCERRGRRRGASARAGARRRLPAQGGDGQRRVSRAGRSMPASARTAFARSPSRRESAKAVEHFLEVSRAEARRARSALAAEPRAT